MLGLSLLDLEGIELFADTLQRLITTDSGIIAANGGVALCFRLLGFLLTGYSRSSERCFEPFQLGLDHFRVGGQRCLGAVVARHLFFGFSERTEISDANLIRFRRDGRSRESCNVDN